MTRRTAPAAGYTEPPKIRYRRELWNVFRAWTGCRTAEAWALLMPSSEGDEVDIAIQKGFREDRLVIVDDNTAIVASLKGRRFPRVTAVGGRIGIIGPRVAAKGVRLHVVNCDFTGTVHTAGPELAAFADSGVLAPASLIGVTVLKGRENHETMHELRQATNDVATQHLAGVPSEAVAREITHLCNQGLGALHGLSVEKTVARERLFSTDKLGNRLAYLGTALSRGVHSTTLNPWFARHRMAMLNTAREYRSQTQTMIWAVYKVHQQPCFCDSCVCNFAWQGSTEYGWSPARVIQARREYYGLTHTDDYMGAILDRQCHIGYNGLARTRAALELKGFL